MLILALVVVFCVNMNIYAIEERSSNSEYIWKIHDYGNGEKHKLKIERLQEKYEGYCFQLSKSFPSSESSSNQIMYKKLIGTSDNLAEYVSGNVKGKSDKEKLKKQISKIVNLGYPNGKNGIMKEFSDEDAIDITQQAIWFFTESDSKNNLDGYKDSWIKNRFENDRDAQNKRAILKKLISEDDLSKYGDANINIFVPKNTNYQAIISVVYIKDITTHHNNVETMIENNFVKTTEHSAPGEESGQSFGKIEENEESNPVDETIQNNLVEMTINSAPSEESGQSFGKTEENEESDPVDMTTQNNYVEFTSDTNTMDESGHTIGPIEEIREKNDILIVKDTGDGSISGSSGDKEEITERNLFMFSYNSGNGGISGFAKNIEEIIDSNPKKEGYSGFRHIHVENYKKESLDKSEISKIENYRKESTDKSEISKIENFKKESSDMPEISNTEIYKNHKPMTYKALAETNYKLPAMGKNYNSLSLYAWILLISGLVIFITSKIKNICINTK